MIVHLHNFRTNKVDEVELDKLDAEHALDFLPIDIEPVHKRFLEYAETGMAPAEALKMTMYELLLALKDALGTAVEYIGQDTAKSETKYE